MRFLQALLVALVVVAFPACGPKAPEPKPAPPSAEKPADKPDKEKAEKPDKEKPEKPAKLEEPAATEEQ